MISIIGAVCSLFGSIFLFLGALGTFRMPDIYNRMQAGTKATTLGSILFLIGIAIGFHECTCIPKVIILIVFIIFTNPISSHTLARASHFIHLKLTEKTVTDQLAEDEQKEEA